MKADVNNNRALFHIALIVHAYGDGDREKRLFI